MPSVTTLKTTALLLAVASIVAMRALRMFAASEVLAVLAFMAGAALAWAHRRTASNAPLAWPERLIVAGSVLGLGGLLLKGLFMLLGIGAESHDMATHTTQAAHPLLVHIHHLFFNIGFLCFLVAAILLLVRRLRARA